MRSITKVSSLAILGILAMAGMAHAQDRGLANSRIMLDMEWGSDSGLGFKPFHLAVGASVEVPLLNRLEFLPAFSFSPDHKTFSDTGHSIIAKEAWDYWFLHRVGAYGGVEYSAYWSTQPHGEVCSIEAVDPTGFGKAQVRSCSPAYTTPLHKGGWIPFAGAVVRDGWFQAPGRLYVSYIFPTGCVWAEQCQLPTDGIQSNQIHGVHALQEFRLYSHVRVGIDAEVLRFYDQSNPQMRTKRTGHTTGTMAMTLRLEFGNPKDY